MRKLHLYIVIVGCIISLFIGMFIGSYALPSCNSPPPPPSPPPSPQVDDRIKWGIAPAFNIVRFGSQSNTKKMPLMPLSKIIDKIDVFWDWQAEYKSDRYDLDIQDHDVGHKFMPMEWTAGVVNPNAQILINYLKKNYGTKYVLSWNEPDMTGTILPASATGENDTGASSAGFWTALPFVYGNRNTEDLTAMPSKLDKNDNSFFEIAKTLKSEYNQYIAINSDLKIATPVMANGPIISLDSKCVAMKPGGMKIDQPCGDMDKFNVQQPCGGIWLNDQGVGNNTRLKCGISCKIDASDAMCNGFPIVKGHKHVNSFSGDCVNQCGTKEDPKQECRCNGWLKLLKLADTQNNIGYWELPHIINIHAYHYKAHMIKLRILETMYVFKNDIRPKGSKEIWLTETACTYPNGVTDDKQPTTDPIGIKENTTFVQELFWRSTTVDDSIRTCANQVLQRMNMNDIGPLPGLRSREKFSFLGNKDKSWYDMGFGGVTFFSGIIPGWHEACFPDNVNYVDSRIFSKDMQLNDIWSALVGDKK